MTPDDSTPSQDSPVEASPFRRFVELWGPRIESTLEDIVPPTDVEPRRLHEAMRYALFPGGKRLRPMLALLGSLATGGAPTRDRGIRRPGAWGVSGGRRLRDPGP